MSAVGTRLCCGLTIFGARVDVRSAAQFEVQTQTRAAAAPVDSVSSAGAEFCTTDPEKTRRGRA